MNDHKERAAFSISRSLKAELEEAVPVSQRSEFVERAIADALLRDAKARALKALDDASVFPAKGEDSVEVLRRIRNDRQTGLVARQHAARS